MDNISQTPLMLITGGGRGVGAATARLVMRADSTGLEQVDELFAAIDRSFGSIDVLVNNAGILSVQSRLEDLGFERMRRILVCCDSTLKAGANL